MGVAQKTIFSISDRLVKLFGKSGAPMEHNTTAKSKQTFLEIWPFWHKRPRTKLPKRILQIVPAVFSDKPAHTIILYRVRPLLSTVLALSKFWSQKPRIIDV